MPTVVRLLISHSFKDGDTFVHRLSNELAKRYAHNVDVWMPKKATRTGHEWLGQILEQASMSHATLFAMTADSIKHNSACHDEVVTIQEHGHTVIPLVASDKVTLYPTFVPPDVAYIDFRSDAFRDGMSKLENEISLLASHGPLRRDPIPGAYWMSQDMPAPSAGVFLGRWQFTVIRRRPTVMAAIQFFQDNQWRSKTGGALLGSLLKDGGTWSFDHTQSALTMYSGTTKEFRMWKLDGWYGPNAFGGTIPDGSRFRARRML
jgi:hypothetical protein